MSASETPAPGANSHTEALARIEAATRRLGDLKAAITCGDGTSELEQLAFSVRCYLDGIEGPYLTEARHTFAAAPALYDVVRYAVDNPEFDSAVFDQMARAALLTATQPGDVS